jgi:predicted XRE-type DNA-binding protein
MKTSTRYIELFKLLHRSGISQVRVAQAANCSASNVNHFMHGDNNSVRVARSIAILTGRMERVLVITGLSREDLERQEAA